MRLSQLAECLRKNAEMDRTLGYPKKYIESSAYDYVRLFIAEIKRESKLRSLNRTIRSRRKQIR